MTWITVEKAIIGQKIGSKTKVAPKMAASG
jgi:hypothetical protein